MTSTHAQQHLACALETADRLKAGGRESVETLAMLAVELGDDHAAGRVLATARQAADSLKPGTWESVRALTWPAKAERASG